MEDNLQTQNSEMEQKLNGLMAEASAGASWFYWIAGLSLINYGIYAFGGNTRFVVGLGISELATAFIYSVLMAIVANALVAAIFIGFGVLASGGRTWAFVLGMIIYALDALLFIPYQDYMSIGFHVFALYCLFRGLQACIELGRLSQAAPPTIPVEVEENVM